MAWGRGVGASDRVERGVDVRLDELSGPEYREWFAEHRGRLLLSGPFHQPEWLEAASQGVGFELRHIGLFDGGELIGAVPGFLARKGPFRLFGSPLRGTMTSYLGPTALAVPDDLDALLAACAAFARRRWGAGYVRFTSRDARDASPTGWEVERPRSYRLGLDVGVEALWSGLKSDCRRNIKRARNLGIETVPLDDPSLFHRILDNTLRRHGTTSWHSERFFRELLERVVPSGSMWAWGARFEGQIVAAALFLHDAREVHFVSGASLPTFGSLPTSYLLHWTAIERGAEKGLSVFNSDASKVRSIDRFKESFGPDLERRETLIRSTPTMRRAQRAVMHASGLARRWAARRGATEPRATE